MNEISDNLIKEWPLFKGMTDKEINKVLDESVNKNFKNGEILCKQGDQSNSMFILLFGRVQIQLTKKDNTLQNLNVLTHGDHFGELSLLTGGTRTATVSALMDTTVLIINKDHFRKLLSEIPSFSININNTLSKWLQGELLGKPVKHKIKVIGLIRTASETPNFTQQIVNWACKHNGKSVEVFTDQITLWQGGYSGCQVHLHSIPANIEDVHKIIQKLGQIEKKESRDHVFLDISITHESDYNVINKLLNQCEHNGC